MKISFHSKLAFDGMRKNKRMYLPYILTCVGMVMMLYIVNFLKSRSYIFAVGSGRTIEQFMDIGSTVLVVFSAVFLFYTNSFLIRRRKKEFGLYNILGMGKKNIGMILFFETLFTAVISLIIGHIGGVAFSKLAEIAFVNILKGQPNYDLTVSIDSIIGTSLPFAVIFLLLFLNSLRQVWFSSAISLLRSENKGEKPPRANYVMGIVGIVLLAAAYYIAVTIQDPMTAIFAFIIAVIMVIIATYLIMIWGSVMICRLLQKKKNYYYKPNHFVSVSSMVYRMKRNGAGLASICILATMVLVMLSSTTSLVIGAEGVLNDRYPRQFSLRVVMRDNSEISDERRESIKQFCNEYLKKYNSERQNPIEYRRVSIAGKLNGGDVIFNSQDIYDYDMGTYSDVVQIYLVPIEDYNSVMNRNVTLNDDEVLVYAHRIDFDGDSFGFQGVNNYSVKEHLDEFFPLPDMISDIVPSLVVVVPDTASASRGLVDHEGYDMTSRSWRYMFDTSLDKNDQIELEHDMNRNIWDQLRSEDDNYIIWIDGLETDRESFFTLYGGIFYLGILLSIVFVFAAVLIIYYKQISEGYEDVSRFDIMQKVGMTKKTIRKSINSQLLIVFFMPLVFAGMHLLFAFPIIEKLLLIFELNNHNLFVSTTVISFLIFALFYCAIYVITSNAYYRIVSRPSRD